MPTQRIKRRRAPSALARDTAFTRMGVPRPGAVGGTLARLTPFNMLRISPQAGATGYHPGFAVVTSAAEPIARMKWQRPTVASG